MSGCGEHECGRDEFCPTCLDEDFAEKDAEIADLKQCLEQAERENSRLKEIEQSWLMSLQEALETEALWKLQHRREIEAIQRWRTEDPSGRELTCRITGGCWTGCMSA